MRVLHLISSAGWYGAENALVNLAAASRRLGCDAMAGVLRDARNPHIEVAQEARAREVPAEIFPCRGRLDFGAMLALRRFAAANRVDVLHTHGYKANFYASSAARRRGPLLVTTFHTGAEQPETAGFLRFYDGLNRLLLRRADHIVAVSEAIARGLRAQGIPARRLTVIDNGVDPARFELPRRKWEDAGAADRVIGVVGRLIREKGLYCLLEAAARVIAQVPEALFVLIGDGPERAGLEQAAAQAGIASRVRLAGMRSDMPEVYASLDVFALPSFSEGMPMTVLEAMAAGLPVVATSVGAIPELLEPDCGVLCPAGDAGALAEALIRVLRDEAAAREMGAAARRRLEERYSAEASARAHLKLYAALPKR